MSIPKIYRRTFNTTGAIIIAPAVGGRIYKVVAFSVHNNETVDTNSARVRIYGGIDFYGSVSYAIHLSGRGDNFFLPFRVTDPYFSTGAGAALKIFSQVSARHISGWIAWIVEDP